MNRTPDHLDAEERALAELLARDPLPGPSPQLDARILASARAATMPAGASRRPSPRWIAGMGIAATLVLAVGIAWRLRPLPERPMARDVPVAAVRVFEPRAGASRSAADEVASPQMQPAVQEAKPVPPERESAPPAIVRAPVPEAPVVFDAPAPMDSAAAAPGPPAPPPPAPAAEAGVAANIAHAPAASQAAKAQAPGSRAATADAFESARARDDGPTLDRVEATGSRISAAEAADAAASGEVLPLRAELDEEPPATADSPMVRDAWLQRIRELVASGDTDAARNSLAEFRHRYPKYRLPEDLRALATP